MKVLITGGAGFIGANASARFLRRRDEVVILDSLSREGAEQNLKWLSELGKFRFYRADIRDARAISSIICEHSDAELILHLSAQPAVTSAVDDPRLDFEVNALGSFNLLEALRAVRSTATVIFSSTNKVYGSLSTFTVAEREKRYEFVDVCAIPESAPLDFHSPHGCSKGVADQYFVDYARIYGLKSVTLRQSCIYGTHQFGTEDQGWISWFVIAFKLKKPITICGSGKQVRDVLFIDDLLDCFEAVHRNIETAKGKAYNIGGGPDNTVSLLELLDILEEHFGYRPPLSYAPARPGDQLVYISDISRAREELDWRPKTPFSQGLRDLINWVERLTTA